ncbi:MAG: polysaccharide deacetylase family protein [Eubacteriales bacterium]|nr:polysaccharide deacetylase family protein [Eubacteriales bacterium]
MEGTLIVSLDFELFWGMLDKCALEDYQDNVLGGRKAVPKLLQLFQKYGIHATWATVGFMFAKNYDELSAFFPEESLRPTYENKKLDPYGYFAKVGANEQEAPCFYAPSLIRLVSQAPGQEIGSHTFSHYYCREKGQTPQQFAADMEAAKAIAEKYGYALTSVILPRNQCEPEYTQVLRDCGFTAYRDEENDWIHEKIKFRPLLRLLRLADVYFPLTGQGGYLPRNENGIWNLTGSRMYKPIFAPLRFLEGVKLKRIKRQMLHAAKKGLTFHLWWHPHNIGVDTQAHLAQLEEVFRYYQQLRETYGMESLNMREAAQKREKAEDLS